GEAFANAARTVVDQSRFSIQQVLCAGIAGQSLWHHADARFAAALELGMTDVVAERTGLTVVSDFRTRDLVAGGQASPLGALIDYVLFHDPKENRVLIHLGGVTTIVWLPKDPNVRGVLGFQAAPGTLLLDGIMGFL